MKKIFLSLVMALSVTTAAFALDLQEARSKGMVREKADGFIEAVASSAEVSSLVAEVNAKRKAEYERISKENGQPVDVVGKLAAEQIKQSR